MDLIGRSAEQFPRSETARLRLRRVGIEDAQFIFTLYNDPDFIRFVGDRGVATVGDAEALIRERFLPYYEQGGLGACVVELIDTRVPIGVCTLFKRPWLDDVDLGFAFLPAYRSRGYALESARRMVEHASASGLERLLAIVSAGNARSERLLARLGFELAGQVQPPGDPTAINLFTAEL